FNSTLLGMLASYASKYGKDWDTYLPFVAFAYRSSVQASTDESPFMLMYGREAMFPSDVNVGTEFAGSEVDLLKRMADIRKKIPKRIEEAQRIQKRYYDRKRKFFYFIPGDLCWLKDEVVEAGTISKLRMKWKGPYEILERRGEQVYVIRNKKLIFLD